MIRWYNTRGPNPNAGPYRTMTQYEQDDLKKHHDPSEPRKMSYDASEGYKHWHYGEGFAEISNETTATEAKSEASEKKQGAKISNAY